MFKVGDRAVVLIANYAFEKVGDVIEITKIESSYNVLANHPNDIRKNYWAWYIDRIRPLTPLEELL